MTALGAVTLGAVVISLVCADLRWLRVAQHEHYLPRAARAVRMALVGEHAAEHRARRSGCGRRRGCDRCSCRGSRNRRQRGDRASRPSIAWPHLAPCLDPPAISGRARHSCAGGSRNRTGSRLRGSLGRRARGGVERDRRSVVSRRGAHVLRPAENLLAQRYVTRASAVLARVRPLVVGITGSYGKTTTKTYVAHLIAGDRIVVGRVRVASTDRAGLARTVNENLVPGTEVLVAEMGAYGPGEISALCSWLHPEVAVITSIGPAHLERFGTLDRTLSAKAEISSTARVVVLNIDDERLEALTRGLDATQKVVRVSGTDMGADVAVMEHADGLELRLRGRLSGVVVLAPGCPSPIRSNAACAAAVALELGISPEVVVRRLASLPSVPNRLQRYRANAGYVVLDDTFNANPAGARLALDALESEAHEGRRVLVTPGMVELGKTQRSENAALGEAAAGVVTDLIVVGRTNRAALVEGSRRAGRPVSVKLVGTREEAVTWAREQLGARDAVLFENDLPDHFP